MSKAKGSCIAVIGSGTDNMFLMIGKCMSLDYLKE